MPLWSASMKLSTLDPTSDPCAPAPAAPERTAATAAARPAAKRPRLFELIDFPLRTPPHFVAGKYHRARRCVLDETGGKGPAEAGILQKICQFPTHASAVYTSAATNNQPNMSLLYRA